MAQPAARRTSHSGPAQKRGGPKSPDPGPNLACRCCSGQACNQDRTGGLMDHRKLTAPRFYTLWAINAALDERELCRQLERMPGAGFDGTVFHPRFYPNKPPYLSDEYLAILSRVILHAKSIGMDFWIYDENGWPSGTVGGELLKHHPDDVQQWADLLTEPPAECLGSFERRGRRWFVARRRGAGVDYLNPNLAPHFIEMTYERYRQGLSPAAFEHVRAFCCDEPEFGLGHAYDALSP